MQYMRVAILAQGGFKRQGPVEIVSHFVSHGPCLPLVAFGLFLHGLCFPCRVCMFGILVLCATIPNMGHVWYSCLIGFLSYA